MANPSEGAAAQPDVADQIAAAQATQKSAFEQKMAELRETQTKMTQLQAEATRTAQEAKTMAESVASLVTTLSTTMEQQQHRLDGMASALAAIGAKLGLDAATLNLLNPGTAPASQPVTPQTPVAPPPTPTQNLLKAFNNPPTPDPIAAAGTVTMSGVQAASTEKRAREELGSTELTPDGRQVMAKPSEQVPAAGAGQS
jgi:hypothetical protein